MARGVGVLKVLHSLLFSAVYFLNEIAVALHYHHVSTMQSLHVQIGTGRFAGYKGNFYETGLDVHTVKLKQKSTQRSRLLMQLDLFTQWTYLNEVNKYLGLDIKCR